MSIKWLSKTMKLGDLHDYEHNPRIITETAFNKLVERIKEDGYHQRIVVDTDGTIVGGHQRKRALLASGYSEDDSIEVLIPERKLTPDEFDRINIVDNLPFGDFDFDVLANNFEPEQLIDWGMPEDWLPVVPEVLEPQGDPDSVPDIPDEPTSKEGDLYILGEHRLLCGDSTNPQHVERLLAGQVVDLVYMDPPYGINEQTDRDFGSRTRLAKGNSFPKIIGDDSTQTGIDAYNLCDSLCATVCMWGGNYFADKLDPSACWLVWDKRVDDNQRDANSDCELAYVKHPKKKSVRIFRHLWKGMLKDSERGEGRVHPTQKPVELARWAFDELDKESATVLDLFGGSGSTLIACEATGRKCYMMELSPKYVDVIVQRWEEYTGEKAKLEAAP